MSASTVNRIHRTDYLPPSFFLDQICLDFALGLDCTEVSSTLHLRPNPANPTSTVRLDGEHLTLLELTVNGLPISPEHYTLSATSLSFQAPSQAEFVVQLRNQIHPSQNSTLMGMYASRGALFTQCEAEGMRRITFIPDRPDVLARYRVRLEANQAQFPVLLSNGNLVDQGTLEAGRHFAVWEDPFPKPSYLFAVVAADLVSHECHMQTMSGRRVLLQIWGEQNDLPRLDFALQSLCRALTWDEIRFGRELDLDRYMIVATTDFNMGAMENKGLNIFNAKYVLADPDVATDTDYANIESIIGHEYFHNWSGNRVTCQDWFQLSLKEGLTVFRDQEFTADLLAQDAGERGADPQLARAIARIGDVQALRAVQFPEDAGPMAHPIRPDSYLEISNFYTATVYEKGAEVVRMLQTLLGRTVFRQGLDLYFARHDGTAATCDQFVQAMSDASGRNLNGFLTWYSQSGTPTLRVLRHYDPLKRTLDLHCTQSTAPNTDQANKLPLHIPLAIGMLDASGQALAIHCENVGSHVDGTLVLELTKTEQTFRLTDVPPGAVPSLLRQFSAPVQLDFALNDDELALLANHDSDGFNRWEACQRIYLKTLHQLTDDFELGTNPQSISHVSQLFKQLLSDAKSPHAYTERALQLPPEIIVAEQRQVIRPRAIHQARRYLRQQLGSALSDQWHILYSSLSPQQAYEPSPAESGRRALRNMALSFLCAAGDTLSLNLARQQLATADNLTDRYAALAAIVHSHCSDKADILLQLARQWQHQPLLMNKWLSVQATAPAAEGEAPTLEKIRVLQKNPAYSAHNPNNVYALILGFCQSNPAEFHRADGSGYHFWLEQVLQLDRINPIVAARVTRALERWQRYEPQLATQMQMALSQLSMHPSLSRDVQEIVDRALRKI